MIVTLTLNPSLDHTIEVDRLERGAVLRTSEPVLEPGGKGVNVTRALTANGIPSLAIAAVAGPEGAELSRLLERDGILCRFVPVSGRTRSNRNTESGQPCSSTTTGAPGSADRWWITRRSASPARTVTQGNAPIRRSCTAQSYPFAQRSSSAS